MTTKTEQQGSVGAEPAGTPAERPKQETTLPSIIVDPAALASVPPSANAQSTPPPAEGQGERAEAPAGEPAENEPEENAQSAESAAAEGPTAPSGNGVDRTPSKPPPEAAARETTASEAEPLRTEGDQLSLREAERDRFSALEAERFAEQFRPSWDPPQPARTSLTARSSAQPSVAASAAVAHDAPRAHAHEPQVPLVLPGAHKQRGLLLVALAVLGFVLLLVLALWSTHGHEPAAPPPATESAASTETTGKSPPPEPEPATSTAQAPAPPAAAVVEPAAAEASAAVGEQTAATAPAAEANAEQEQAAPAAEATEQPAEAPAAPAAAASEQAAPAAPSEEPEQPAPAAVPAPSAVTAPEMVNIRLSTVPARATLTIDGTRVANPYSERAPVGGRHRIVAEAPGYREADVTLGFDRDRDLTLHLTKKRSHAASAHRAAELNRISQPAPPAPKPPKGAGFVTESPY